MTISFLSSDKRILYIPGPYREPVKAILNGWPTPLKFVLCLFIRSFTIVSKFSLSFFAVSKSGTVSLEICNAKVPSIIIYKMNFLNFIIIKLLVKIKFANIINIAADELVIPELLQSNCNPQKIFDTVDGLLSNKENLAAQIRKSQEIIKKFKTENPSHIASSILLDHL